MSSSTTTQAIVYATSDDLDQVWIFFAACLVFFMQLGFTMLESGSIKVSNVQNILFKNLMDACIGAITFYFFGFCIAYGDATSTNANGFIGIDNLVIKSKDFTFFFFQFAFAATASTIVSGAVAERCSLAAYFLYTSWITIWIYPVVVHWAWSDIGWISPFNSSPSVYAGVIDFAGSGVVHMVGGISGLMGAIALGPRFRRFSEENTSKYALELKHQFTFGHNVPNQVFGTFILWFGWYGFNSGSSLCAVGCMNVASKAAVTTTLAAASSGLTAAFVSKGSSWYINRNKEDTHAIWSIPRACNGVLAGLVSITAPCATINTGYSILIGFIGSLVYYASSLLMEFLKVDDPLDAFAVHGCCGIWGVIAAGIFSDAEGIANTYGDDSPLLKLSRAERFATQLTFVAVVIGWTAVNAGGLFFLLKFFGVLRVSEDVERKGMDIVEHGGVGVTLKKTYTFRGDVKHRATTSTDDEQDHELEQINEEKDKNTIATYSRGANE